MSDTAVPPPAAPTAKPPAAELALTPAAVLQPPGEHNGPKGPEPTRYGDWEQKGRCTDF